MQTMAVLTTDPEKGWQAFVWPGMWGAWELFPRTSSSLGIMQLLMDFPPRVHINFCFVNKVIFYQYDFLKHGFRIAQLSSL